jgi:hypothetical protein
VTAKACGPYPVLVTAGGLLLLLSGCLQPEPRSLEPSSPASAGVSMPANPSPTSGPATPQPSGGAAAEVTIAIDTRSMSYTVDGCPVTAWLDPKMEDGVDFGTYPQDVIASDGTLWSTHMAVLRMLNGSPTDWSFTLTTALDVPGGIERRLISRPEAEITAALSEHEATFTTLFWDSEDTSPVPQPLTGTVVVTCE